MRTLPLDYYGKKMSSSLKAYCSDQLKINRKKVAILLLELIRMKMCWQMNFISVIFKLRSNTVLNVNRMCATA